MKCFRNSQWSPLQVKNSSWDIWEKEARPKLSKLSYFKKQDTTPHGSLILENLDTTFLSAIILDPKAQPDDVAKRYKKFLHIIITVNIFKSQILWGFSFTTSKYSIHNSGQWKVRIFETNFENLIINRIDKTLTILTILPFDHFKALCVYFQSSRTRAL